MCLVSEILFGLPFWDAELDLNPGSLGSQSSALSIRLDLILRNHDLLITIKKKYIANV